MREGMRGDRGSVTAEAAVALPALVLVGVALASVVTLASAQLRCIDGAREASRAAARSEPAGVIHHLAVRAAPAGATVQVAEHGDKVSVTVRVRVQVLHGMLPDVALSAESTSLVEPRPGPGRAAG
jgi:hypothetical protein